MRFKESVEQEKYLHQAVQKGDMELDLAGLNVLGRTAWRINEEIFNVVLKVWNAGEKIGKLPAAVYGEPEPQVRFSFFPGWLGMVVLIQRVASE